MCQRNSVQNMLTLLDNRITQLVKQINYNCTIWRVWNSEFVSQKMEQLPIERLKPPVLWQYISLDSFETFMVKEVVNKHAERKAYGLLFNCLTRRTM